MKTHYRPGLPLHLPGAPRQEIGAVPQPRTVAVFAEDAPGLVCTAVVTEGDEVAAGDPVLRGRETPAIAVVAPVSGRVESVTWGPRRRPVSVVIAVEGARRLEFPVPADPDAAAARELLQRAGLWTAFLSRPFGHVPGPDERPEAIFVTAIDLSPHAPNPARLVAATPEAFQRGAAFLTRLTEGTVHVCQPPGAPLAEGTRIRCTGFSGGHPAGLAGTHIDILHPLTPGRRVWQIEAQDVAAIGHLLGTGTIEGERVIALAGPGFADPRLVRATQGAALDDLAEGGLAPGAMRLLSGGPLGGIAGRHLRRRHRVVTALHRPVAPAPAPRRRWPFAGAAAARPAPLIPNAAIEAAFGPRLPVIPLLRALSVGDAPAAARLGAASLLEEDLALVSYAAATGEDFGHFLRQSLDLIAEAGA